jgi:integrase
MEGIKMKKKLKSTGHGAIDNLLRQEEKIIRNMNQNKFQTRNRYIGSETRFIKFTAKDCKLQKLANIKDKHLEKYVDHLKEKGASDKYIKTELSGIRFFHNNTPEAKNRLEDSTVFNKKVGLESTPDNKNIDRAWTEKEVEKMKNKTISLNREEIAKIIEVVRATGCRINEAVTLRDSDLREAIKEKKLHLTNTKGGVPRDVPLTERAKKIFEEVLEETPRGGYAFTPQRYVEEHKIHSFKKSVQNFIYNHRKEIQDEDRSESAHNVEDSKGALTVHGLRHAFAREQYYALKNVGFSSELAKKQVSEMLGHHRKEVTEIYLGGLK